MPLLGEIHGTANGCAACGQQFGALAQFDAHQDVDYDREPVLICRAPATMGLILDDRGVWQTPKGLVVREAHRKHFQAWNTSPRQPGAAQEPEQPGLLPQ